MSIFIKIKEYFVGAIGEMKKVSWPTKKQTINYSGVVVGLSIFTALLLGIIDYIFNIGLEKIITK